MANTNSFAENMNRLTKDTADALDILAGINEAMTTNEDEVTLGNNMKLPAYTNIINRVNRAENTVAKFTQGKGIVETDDGTYRKIKVSTISRPPETITDLEDVNTFYINPNWFFESLQYPRCIVKLDLTGKIDDESDRVYVNRVILDANEVIKGVEGTVLNYYNANIKGNTIGYAPLITNLENAGIHYREDKDTVYLPLTYEKYKGEFAINDVRLIKDEKGNSQAWYYLNTLYYSVIDENDIEQSNGHMLKVGDHLRFNDSLYKIAEISQEQGRVKLEYAVGYETIGIGDILEFYNEPFGLKEIEVGIGVNEIDIIYVKGVNENYNLLARDWSNPVSFYTNDLLSESGEKFFEYYSNNVADFGNVMISQAKEKQIYAYNGKVPYAPVLNDANLKVVQINTQLDATLDTETYNNLTSQIASTKSDIASTRNTISSNKDLLIQSTSADDRTNVQNIINTDTEKLNSLTTQYNSLVEELNTLLNESGAINYTPKYHVRGFFAIPNPRYSDETNNLGEQDVIGFDIMYRYLHTDETGVKLDTYEYADNDATIQTGVFTDWNMITSSMLTKMYDEETDTYIWSTENTADGSKININQIDIPIKNGEKVEIKVRSISEAGYPYNPLKSDWSNSVIISFPENLTSNDSVTTILETIKSDMTAVVLQETMSAAGVYTHMADSNSSYKHTATNVSYTDSVIDASTGKSVLTEMSVQDKMKAMMDQMTEMKKSIPTSSIDVEEVARNTAKEITESKLENVDELVKKSVNDATKYMYASIIEMLKFIGYKNINEETLAATRPALSNTTKTDIVAALNESNELIGGIANVIPGNEAN